jgi:hypothetical protein
MDMPYNMGEGLKFEPSAKEKPIPNFPGRPIQTNPKSQRFPCFACRKRKRWSL